MTVSHRSIPHRQGAGTAFHHIVLMVCLMYLILVGTDLLTIVLWKNNLANKLEILTLVPILATTSLYYRHLLRGTFAAPELTILTLWTTLSMGWSDFPMLSLERAIPLLVTTAFGLALASMMSMRGLLLFFAAFFSTVMALCVLAIATLPQARGIPPWGDTWNGIYGHKNELGSTSVLAFLTSCFAVQQTAGRLKTLFMISAIVAFLLLLASESRTAQVIGIVVITGYFTSRIFTGKEMLWAIGFILISVFAICLITFILASPIAEPFFAMIGRKPTLSDRIPIWTIAWPFVMDKFWFGWGYLAYWYEEATHLRIFASKAKLGFVPHYSHNGLIELWLNAGFVGVVLFFVVLVRFFGSAFYCLRRLGRRDEVAFVFTLGMTFLFLNITESEILNRLSASWIIFVAFTTKTNLVAKALRATPTPGYGAPPTLARSS